MRRSFLALQGTASPFFSELATALMARGHRFTRVNFCGGDAAYAGSEPQLNFVGRSEELASWYESTVEEHRITDILMFGDCRAVHLPIHEISQRKGRRVHVFEEGYVRPNWITLEEIGVNGRSYLPRDASSYLAQSDCVPACPLAMETGYNLYERAFHDIRYRFANTLFNWRFRHYRSHRPNNGLLEYAGLAVRALRQRRHGKKAQDVMQELATKGWEYFIFPLQLNSDRRSSSIRHLMVYVMLSNGWSVRSRRMRPADLTSYKESSARYGSDRLSAIRGAVGSGCRRYRPLALH